MADADQVIDDTASSRFEITENGELAELIYRRRADRLVLIHTGVPETMGGRGIGGLLVQAALRKAESEGLTVVPLCPFARNWLERHPQEAATVTIDWAQPADG
jgi:uncharacterized protein